MSRLKCNDAWIKDLKAAVKVKTANAKRLNKTQSTEYRVAKVEKFQKLEDSLSTLMKILSESQENNFRNRSMKIKNIM